MISPITSNIINSVKLTDGIVDIILYDSSSTYFTSTTVKKSELLSFDVNDMTSRACDMIIGQSIPNPHNKTAMIYGCGKIGKLIAQKLITRGFNILIVGRNRKSLESIRDSLTSNGKISILPKDDKHFYTKLNSLCQNTSVLISSVPSGTKVISLTMIENVPDDCLIIDVGIGTIYPHAIETANHLQKNMIRLDIIAAFNGELKGILETRKLARNITCTNIGDSTYVSGGFIGKRGDIVLRDINDKTSVIGIADGCGGLIHD